MTTRTMSIEWKRIRIDMLPAVYNICAWLIELLAFYIMHTKQTKPFQDWWICEWSAIIIVLCIHDIVIIRIIYTDYIAVPVELLTYARTTLRVQIEMIIIWFVYMASVVRKYNIKSIGYIAFVTNGIRNSLFQYNDHVNVLRRHTSGS